MARGAGKVTCRTNLPRDYRFGVPEETGLGAGAARARETVLAESVGVPGGADRVVIPTLRAAYVSVLRGRRQLDTIAADIESAVANQQALALDTPAGAATFSKFLAAKTQHINRVVAETAAGSQAGAATLGSRDDRSDQLARVLGHNQRTWITAEQGRPPRGYRAPAPRSPPPRPTAEERVNVSGGARPQYQRHPPIVPETRGVSP